MRAGSSRLTADSRWQIASYRQHLQYRTTERNESEQTGGILRTNREEYSEQTGRNESEIQKVKAKICSIESFKPV